MPQQPLSNVEINHAVLVWTRHNHSRKLAAAELGISESALDRRLEAGKKRGYGVTSRAVTEQVAARLEARCEPVQMAKEEAPKASPFDPRIVRLQDENSQLKRELKQAVRDQLNTEKIRREIIGIADVSAAPPSWLVDLSKRDHSGPGTPMTIWSDWHWSEVVRRDEVGGVNEFDLSIAHRRARRLVDKIVKLAFNHQVHAGYPGIVVCLGGDMISGEIHGELADTNEMKTIPAIWDIYNVLIAMLKEVADKFGNVFVPCVVGNHGRNTLKPRAKSRVYTSFEWLLYVMLERYFEHDPRVRFFVPNDIDALFKVNGTRYLLTHGDALGVKGGDGIIGALGPIMRGRIKVGHAQAQIGRDFDVMLQGHWHQYLALMSLITNGSLKGYDEYARTILRAPFQLPIQAMWYDHPLVGITKHEPIYLEDQRSAGASDGWVSLPRA